MTRIINGRIVPDSGAADLEAGGNASSSSWMGGMMGSTSTSSSGNTVRLCGREFSTWSIGASVAISFLFGGFRGLFFIAVLLIIAYFMENRGNSSSSSTFNYSSLSTGSSRSGGSGGGRAPERGRSNIKGMKDLPKPAAKC